MKNDLTIILLLSVFLLGCTQNPFKQKIEVISPTISFVEQVDSIVINKMNEYNIPGLSVGLVRNDSIVYMNGFGVKSIDNNDVVTESTIFHTASISKLFTAIAIIQLIEKESIALDDKLFDLLPELTHKDIRAENITIKTLLNHTSGIPDMNNYHWSNNNQADNSLKKYILGHTFKLESEPSDKYQYSNLAYDVLGYVIERVSGATFDDYLKENVLNKNGMFDSDFRYFKILDSLKTTPHSKSRSSNNVYPRKVYPYTREHAPSSTLNSSAKDLSKWMISFIKNLRDSNSVNNYQEMIEPSFSSHPHIGLGFQLSTIESKKTVGHYGGDKGFRSYLMMIPEKKIGIVVLANCDYEEDFRQEIVHSIAKLMLNRKQ